MTASLGLDKMTSVDLSRTDLSYAKLTQVDFTKANLSEANLHAVDFIGINLTEANLASSKLGLATFHFAEMGKTNIENAELNGTIFAACDLSNCVGIGKAKHTGPSHIDIATLTMSFAGLDNRWTTEMQMFFLSAGVSKYLLDALPKIAANIQYYTCFIGYGEPDKAFAEKLTRDLTAKGVSCWIYSLDSTPGESVWGEIGQRRKEAEKMIVLCSAEALKREGVLKELGGQVDEDPDKLIPISLDNLWKDNDFPVKWGNENLKPFLERKNYADFSDVSKYEESLCRLLTGLKKK